MWKMVMVFLVLGSSAWSQGYNQQLEQAQRDLNQLRAWESQRQMQEAYRENDARQQALQQQYQQNSGVDAALRMQRQQQMEMEMLNQRNRVR